ncbi:MAG: Gfo/Idh/MocA family protein [Anaerolineae bacterium]|jgi:predicted dehydrogenase
MADKFRIAIVDLSSDHVWSMGSAFKMQPEVELVALSDVHEELRDKGKSTFEIPLAYSDHLAMLDEVKPDAIVVCGDNAMKAGITEAAAERGIHVCLDKPMSANLAQADRIVSAVASSGILAMVAYHPYFGDSYQAIKGWVNEGRIGQPYLAKASIGHGGPIEIGLSSYFCEWLIDAERNGGGSFVDEACYAISMFTDFFGRVAEISCYTTQQGWRKYLPADVEDNAVAILRFENGMLGVIDAKWGQVGRVPYGRSVHGTEGTILMGFDDAQMFSRVKYSGDEPAWETFTWPRGPRNFQEAAYFVTMLKEKKQADGAASLAWSRHTQEVIEAAYISAREGRSIKLPL